MGGGRKKRRKEKKGAVAPFWVSVSGFVFERKRVFPFLFFGKGIVESPENSLGLLLGPFGAAAKGFVLREYKNFFYFET